MNPDAPPPHPHKTWQEAAYAQNERSAELAAEIERMKLRVDEAKGEGLAIAENHAAFLDRLREAGELYGQAGEDHIVNAMRHARANRAAEDRPYETLVDGLLEILNANVTPDTFSVLPARDASDPRAVLAAVRGEIVNARMAVQAARDGARIEATLDLTRKVAKALDMPSNTPAANVVSRAAALRREVAQLRRDRNDPKRVEPPTSSPPTWEDVKADFKRLGDVLTEIFDGADKPR